MDHKKASLLAYKDVANFLETDLKNGLSHFEAQKRLKRFGFNKLELEKSSKRRILLEKMASNPSLQFLRQLLNPLFQLLLICALIGFCVGQVIIAISVLVAVLIICTISYMQQRETDKSTEEERHRQLGNTCEVIRDGEPLELHAELLVPGDLIHLAEGQRVPADIRLFELYSLTINECQLTGETELQCKQIEPAELRSFAEQKSDMTSKSNELALRAPKKSGVLMAVNVAPKQLMQVRAELVYRNLALMGTVVESGHSYGLVFATGKSTRFAQLRQKLEPIEQPRSPIQSNVEQLSLQLVVIACFLIALTSIVGIVQQRDIDQVVCYAIALAVVALPEGLPVVAAAREDEATQHKLHNFLAYQISISLSLLLLVAISFGTQTDAPFSLSQLLFINILADGPPAQALAMEQASEKELSSWSRDPHEPLFSCRLLSTLFVLTSTLLALNGALYNYLLDASGRLDAHARSLQFACFVFCTLFATISLRARFKTVVETRIHGNKQLLCCCCLVLLLQLALTEIEPLSAFFQMEPVPLVELVYVFLYASSVLIVMDAAKLCLRCLDYARELLMKAIQSLQVPNYNRQQSYSASAVAKSGRFASNADYLGALRPQASQCVAVTPLAAPRTLFGNIMATPKISVSKVGSLADPIREKEPEVDGSFEPVVSKSLEAN